MVVISTQAFDIHGVRLRVESEFTFLAEEVAGLLRRFPKASPEDADALQMTYRNGETSVGLLTKASFLRGGSLFSQRRGTISSISRVGWGFTWISIAGMGN